MSLGKLMPRKGISGAAASRKLSHDQDAAGIRPNRFVAMKDGIIAMDEATGLALVRDGRDPPRFYLRRGRRCDVVAIGDNAAALEAYSRELERLHASRLRQGAAPDGLTARTRARPTNPHPLEAFEYAAPAL
jgi:hypothetical protein